MLLRVPRRGSRALQRPRRALHRSLLTEVSACCTLTDRTARIRREYENLESIRERLVQLEELASGRSAEFRTAAARPNGANRIGGRGLRLERDC